MAAGPPSEDWTKTFNTLKEFHDLSYVKLDEGIKLESEGKKDAALAKYEEGLRLMDLALELRVECPQNVDISWEKACVMLQKLRKTRKEVLSRIADVQVAVPQPPDLSLLPPPSYEEAMSTSPSLSPMSPFPSLNLAVSNAAPIASSSTASVPSVVPRTVSKSGPITYSQLGELLNNLKVQTNTQSAQVIYAYENVRIYYIRPDGTVTAPSEPDTLRVLQLEDGDNEVAKYYLQIGEWFYPLVPDVSPCLRTNYGAYILPDVNSNEDGAAVGLVLPPETDESMSELLGDLLHKVITVEGGEAQSPPLSPRLRRDDSKSAKFSRGLVTGAHVISTGLIKGAEIASKYLNSSTPKLLERVTPEPTPRQVSPTVAKSVKVARDVSGTAVNVTGYVAGKLGSATMALGRYLAPHIQKQGTRLLVTAGGMDEKAASDRVGGMLDVASGAVEGLTTVYNGLEESASILGKSLTDNTVQIVKHKYGQPMGDVTGDTLSTVGNVYAVQRITKVLSPKGIAKLTAKNTGKAVVYDYSQEAVKQPLTQEQQDQQRIQQLLQLHGGSLSNNLNGNANIDTEKSNLYPSLPKKPDNSNL